MRNPGLPVIRLVEVRDLAADSADLALAAGLEQGVISAAARATGIRPTAVDVIAADVVDAIAAECLTPTMTLQVNLKAVLSLA